MNPAKEFSDDVLVRLYKRYVSEHALNLRDHGLALNDMESEILLRMRRYDSTTAKPLAPAAKEKH